MHTIQGAMISNILPRETKQAIDIKLRKDNKNSIKELSIQQYDCTTTDLSARH